MSNWISTEKLREIPKYPVLVFTKGEGMSIMYIPYTFDFNKITHYQLLPEPPTDIEKDPIVEYEQRPHFTIP